MKGIARAKTCPRPVFYAQACTTVVLSALVSSTAEKSEAGIRMAESLVKQLTEGDRVNVRFLIGAFINNLNEKVFSKHTVQGTTWFGIELNRDRGFPAHPKSDE